MAPLRPSNRRALAAVAVVACLLVAGCSALTGPGGTPTGTLTATTAGTATAGSPPTTTAETSARTTGTPTAPRTTATTTPPAPAVVATNFDPAYDLQRVVRRVERLRGLEFTRRVTVAENALKVRLPNGSTLELGTPYDYADRSAEIRPAGAKALQFFSNESMPVLGLAAAGNAGAERVYVGNATQLWELHGIDQEVMLAHELAHTLQDQHGLLESTDYRDTTDGFYASEAMVEGDAELVAQEYYERHDAGGDPPVDRRNRTQPRGYWGLGLSAKTRYHGYHYFRRTDASPAARDAALRDHPDTTAEVIHPGLAADPPGAPVPTADPEGLSAGATDRVGEMTARYALRTNGVPFRRAAAAAAGWRNDSMVTFRSDGAAVFWGTRWANASEATEFATAWRAMLGRLDAAPDGDLLTVPGTDRYPTMHYAIRQDGPLVYVAAAEDPQHARAIADAFPDREAADGR